MNEDNSYEEGFLEGKQKKLKEILEFQAEEECKLIYTQLIFYENFADETKKHLNAFFLNDQLIESENKDKTEE